MAFDPVTFFNDLGSYIATGIGSSFLPTGIVSIGTMPDNPEKIVAIIPADGSYERIDNRLASVRFQILIRTETVEDGLTLGKQIFKLLDTKVNILNNFPGRFEPVTIFVGSFYRDVQNRCIFPLSFQWKGVSI